MFAGKNYKETLIIFCLGNKKTLFAGLILIRHKRLR